MMKAFNPQGLSKRENYRLLTSVVLPRPIAFVTSLGRNGVLNGAPFSFFNVISSEPPLVSISIGRRGTEQKDTARNIVDKGEFVVHVADEANIEAVNQTAANLSPEESEIEDAGLTPVESEVVSVPGLKEAAVRMECRLEKHLVFQEGETTTDFIIGRVVKYHVSKDVYGDDQIDAKKLKAIGRLAGKKYTKLGETFELERPK